MPKYIVTRDQMKTRIAQLMRNKKVTHEQAVILAGVPDKKFVIALWTLLSPNSNLSETKQ